jgi:hypothetical protein
VIFYWWPASAIVTDSIPRAHNCLFLLLHERSHVIRTCEDKKGISAVAERDESLAEIKKERPLGRS